MTLMKLRLGFLNFLNILEYIWLLLNSELSFTDFKRSLIIIFDNFEKKQPSTQKI